ncbi:hypothetical protein RvY_09501 [Ramazzottius varieornatus]|uniref:Mediator complex subunit 16 n=1 Tax=Ramazzottius varieornatus TaxID=947166 RepID=A0A1D1VE46_RAMVA|nr:hypothetical protein RvY_09501 [Ramazzottius varieornatus]
MSSSPLFDEKVLMLSDDLPEVQDVGTPPAPELRESLQSVPDVRIVDDVVHPKARCLFAVSPDLAHPVRTVSRCAVSCRNTLALVTSGVIKKEDSRHTAKPTGSDVESSWPPPLDKPSRKRHFVDLRKGGASTANRQANAVTSGRPSTVYCCDSERPWRLFPVFDVPGEISIVSWSPCGDRLLLCTDLFCFVIASKHSALNSWKLINKARVTSSPIVHALWTLPLTTFVYCPDQSSEKSYFDVPDRPKISLSSESQNSEHNNGFFVVSRTGEVVLVDIVHNEREEDKSEFVAWKGSIEGVENDFNAADAVYDFDEQCFVVVLASPTNPDVVSVTFTFPENNLSFGTNNSRIFTEGISSFRSLNIETATKLHTRNNVVSLKLIISAKIKFLLSATKTSEQDYIELWELSSSDSQRSLLDDPAIVPSDKPTWSLMGAQELPDSFQCWTLAPDRFLTSDIDIFFTVSVALRGGTISLFTIKLGLEVTIFETGQVSPLQAPQYTRGRNGTKKSLVLPEAVAFVTSANGCLTYMVDSACRLWVVALPVTLWPIAKVDDMLEVFLTAELDCSDLIGALPVEQLGPATQKLETLYANLSPSKKKICSTRYQRLKSSLSEKTEGRLASFVPLQSLLYDAVLVYMEQYIDMRNAASRSESSMFQLTEYWSAIRNPESTLEQVSTLIRSNFLLGSDVLRLLLAGFHVILHEIVSLLELVSREPQLLSLLREELPKLRAILSLVYVWASSIPSLRQFFTRSTFAGPGQNVIEILFGIVTLLMDVDGDSAQDWTITITDRLDEANLRSKSTYHEWERTFQQAEPRASSVTNPSTQESLRWMHYTWSYSFLPSHHSDHSNDRAVVATGEPDTDTFNLRPSKRKYCSRCFYSFPWRPTPEYTGTWHSHMRHRWSTCFCGGAWIFLK